MRVRVGDGMDGWMDVGGTVGTREQPRIGSVDKARNNMHNEADAII